MKTQKPRHDRHAAGPAQPALFDAAFTLPPEEVMYRAFYEKDGSFEGIFYTAVKTTGIFCRPTCGAKKPKRENVEFFPTTRHALLYGYRPCKLCRPMEHVPETPDYIRELLGEVQATPDCSLRDGDLRSRGIDPAALRRWFLRRHGITFQAYLRGLRVNRAYARLSEGAAVSDAAFDSGYESLSGFTERFKTLTGASPDAARDKPAIEISKVHTPIGPMFAGISEGKICLLEFTDRPMLETELKTIEKRLGGIFLSGTHPLFGEVERELTEYFQGSRREFTLPLLTVGTPFQEEVWDALRRIPYGQTRSYGDQAVMIRRPEAVRAVARANGENRISIVIPCHRVIGADGSLTGYGGGLWRKRYLLELEQKGPRL